MEKFEGMERWYGLSLAVRLGLILYGVWQDTTMAVKFTDVDYFVFSDAAEFVAKGQSPYERSTYRYPPVLAWLLTPNVWLFPSFGKLLFVIVDVLVGRLIYDIQRKQGHPRTVARNGALVWLLNPLTATVSSRGNAESVMAYLVLKALSHLMDRQTVWAAVFYALSVHFKIYPITFAIPIYLYLGSDAHTNHKSSALAHSALDFFHQLLPNKQRMLFVLVAGGVLGLLTLTCYQIYGWPFLYETYLYHVVRGDIRHNFSPYFYLLYLTSDPVKGVPLCLRLLVFIPQVVLLLGVAFKYPRDPPMAWFLSVFTFVMANKVCTSQYFLWYLSLLPLILPKLRMGAQRRLALVALWFGAQSLWLLPAYLLEFEGQNTFLFIWVAGLFFFFANGVIVFCVVGSYHPNVKFKQEG